MDYSRFAVHLDSRLEIVDLELEHGNLSLATETCSHGRTDGRFLRRGGQLCSGRSTFPFVFPHFSIRTIATGDNADRKVYVGSCHLSAILDFNTDENVRELIPEAGKRMRLGGVHLAIWDTLSNRPDDFQYLNGGLAIVARDVQVDDKRRIATLTNPSIIRVTMGGGLILRLVLRDSLPAALKQTS